jgi:acyl-CoA dehydrogenase
MIDDYRPHWMTEELDALQDMVRRFVADEVVPRQEHWFEQGSTDREFWRRAGELGIVLPDIAEEWGGAGGNFAYEAIIAQELSRVGDTSWRSAKQIHVIAAHYIQRYGTIAQKRRWLPGMASGELIAAVGMSEPGGGTDLQSMRTRAEKQGDGYCINGSKTFITSGSIADVIVLALKTDPTAKSKGVSLFLFDTRTSGFRVGKRLKKIGMHGSDTCELYFDDCDVPVDALLGEVEGQGFYQMMQDLAYERALIAVNCATVMQRAFELTRDYARDRKMFGKTLVDFQHARFELAEIKTEATIARVFIDFLIERMIEGRLDTALASMGKWWTSDRQNETVTRCLQLFGGHGYILETPIARMFVDTRIETIYGGANELMKELIARSL